MTTCYLTCTSQTLQIIVLPAQELIKDKKISHTGVLQNCAMHAFITSKLDYCNSSLYGCRKMQLKKLQHVQNTAARIVTQTRKFDHITPVLFDLHWFPVSYRTVFKILLLVFKSLNNLSPSYLADRLSYQSHSRNLRSASQQVLEQPRSFTKTYGDKAFSVCAPKLWNSLPLDLRKSPSLTGFKKGLKTSFKAIFREWVIVFEK